MSTSVLHHLPQVLVPEALEFLTSKQTLRLERKLCIFFSSDALVDWGFWFFTTLGLWTLLLGKEPEEATVKETAVTDMRSSINVDFIGPGIVS